VPGLFEGKFDTSRQSTAHGRSADVQLAVDPRLKGDIDFAELSKPLLPSDPVQFNDFLLKVHRLPMKSRFSKTAGLRQGTEEPGLARSGYSKITRNVVRPYGQRRHRSGGLIQSDGKMFASNFRNDKTFRQFLPSRSQEKGYRFEGRYSRCGTTLPSRRSLGTLSCSRACAKWSAGPSAMQDLFWFSCDFRFSRIPGLVETQKVISGPIVHLEDTMRMVSAIKNYEVDAVKLTLTRSVVSSTVFNTMLSRHPKPVRHCEAPMMTTDKNTRVGRRDFSRKQAQEELLKAKVRGRGSQPRLKAHFSQYEP